MNISKLYHASKKAVLVGSVAVGTALSSVVASAAGVLSVENKAIVDGHMTDLTTDVTGFAGYAFAVILMIAFVLIVLRLFKKI